MPASEQGPDPPCPRCGAADAIVPIAYGYPSPEMIEGANQGKVRLGGCVIGPNVPAWYCSRCAHPFGRLAGIPAWRDRP